MSGSSLTLRLAKEKIAGSFGQAKADIKPGIAIDSQLEDLRSWNDLLLGLDTIRDDLSQRRLVIELRRLLLGIDLTDQVRDSVFHIIPELKIGEAAVRDHHYEAALEEVENPMNFKFEFHGKDFLRRVLTDNRRPVRHKIDQNMANRLNALCRIVAQKDPGNEKMIQLLYNLLKGDIDTLEAIIEAWPTIEKHEGQEKAPSFLVQLQAFLTIYGDAATEITNASNIKDEQKMRVEAHQVLKDVLSDPKLRVPDAVINIFDVFIRHFPWKWGTNFESTPFDANKLGLLVSPEVPRNALAAALVELNESAHLYYSESELEIVREAITYYKENKAKFDQFAADIKRAKAEVAKKEGKANPDEEALKNLREKVRKLSKRKSRLEVPITGALRILRADEDIRGLPNTADKIIYMEEALLENEEAPRMSPQGFDKSKPDVIRESMFLRVLHPKTIYKDKVAQQRFLEMLGAIRSAEKVNEREALYRSIQLLLADNDPCLDMACIGLGDRCIRDHIVELALDIFTEKQIRDGVGKVKGPIRITVDASERRKKELNGNLNTAATCVSNKNLLRIGAAMANPDMHSFNEIIEFTRRKSRKYFNAKGYHIDCYASATVAFTELMEQLPEVQPDENIVTFNQEYPSITKPFTRRGAKVRAVNMNEKKVRSQRPHTVEEVFESMSKKINGKTRMILMSTRTRFGDTPFSLNNGKSSQENMAELIAMLKEAYPDVPICLDGSQALGRTEADDLGLMKPDLYITSGHKALGVDQTGLLMTSSAFKEKYRYKQNDSGTRPVAYFAAMGVALDRLMSKIDYMHLGGNFGKYRDMTVDQKRAMRSSEVTEYLMMKIEEYGQQFIMDHMLSGKARRLWEQHKKEKLAQWLGARVIYPVHRNSEDYTGVLAMTFPTVNGGDMQRALDKLKHRSTECLQNERGLRLSVDDEQALNTDEIDDYFDTISAVHWELIGHKIENDPDSFIAQAKKAVSWWPGV